MTVFVTSGGTRYHADRACYALANGRSTQAYRAGEGAYGESWYGAGSLPGLYPVAAVPIEALPRARYTACRVCVPPALALPATGQTHGHEPWFVLLPNWRKGYGCARCRVRVRVPNTSRYDDPDDVTGWHHETHAVPWPCTSAVVLGLAPRGGA